VVFNDIVVDWYGKVTMNDDVDSGIRRGRAEWRHEGAFGDFSKNVWAANSENSESADTAFVFSQFWGGF
jgi:hypothetical protein